MTLAKTLFLTCCAFVLGFASVAQAADSKPAATPNLPFNEDQKAALEDFVRNFILDNPEVLMESVNRYRAEEQKKKEESSVAALKEGMGFLTNGKHPQIGNPKGDILVVEFFDYTCGYCKRALHAIQELVEKDKNVKVVFMEYPVLSQQAVVASKWAVAANKQGKYWEFHQALLGSNSPKDEENLAKIATSVGLDVAKLKEDAASKEVDDYMNSIKEFGSQLQVNGTPAFVIGNQIVRGYIEYNAFKTIVDDERKNKK